MQPLASARASNRNWFRASVVSLAAALTFGVTGCGNTLDTGDLEGELVDQLAADAGVDPDDVSVDCPEDIEAEEGREFECTLTAPNDDEVTVEVTLTNDEGGFEAVVPPEQFEES
jgi:hypothetical protein